MLVILLAAADHSHMGAGMVLVVVGVVFQEEAILATD
jgi:hypothetical protein